MASSRPAGRGQPSSRRPARSPPRGGRWRRRGSRSARGSRGGSRRRRCRRRSAAPPRTAWRPQSGSRDRSRDRSGPCSGTPAWPEAYAVEIENQCRFHFKYRVQNAPQRRGGMATPESIPSPRLPKSPAMRSRGTRPLAVFLALGLLAAVPAAAATPPSLGELERLRQELEADPRDDGLRSRYGDLLFQSGDALGSLLVLNPGRKPNPKWAEELRQAANVYLDLAQHDSARRALRDAIALAPEDASLYEELARV